MLDIHLNVAETGKGDALILIHGWSNDWRGWTLVAKKLSPHYKLYMIDLPGYGDSDRLEEYTLDSSINYIHQFIQDQNIKPKAIIGASLGTLVSSYLLKKHPKTSDNLILLGAVFNHLSLQKASLIFKKILTLSEKSNPTMEVVGKTIKSKYTAYLVEKFLNAYKFDKKRIDRYSLPGRRKMTGKSYVQLGLSASKFKLEEYLKTTNKNTLLIYGEADKYVTPDLAKKILSTLKNDKLSIHVINKCGHNPAFEQPGQATKAILKFID